MSGREVATWIAVGIGVVAGVVPVQLPGSRLPMVGAVGLCAFSFAHRWIRHDGPLLYRTLCYLPVGRVAASSHYGPLGPELVA